MMNQNCAKLNSCEKINIIMDKDMLDFQYADCIREVYKKCDRPQAEHQCPYCGKTIEVGVV